MLLTTPEQAFRVLNMSSDPADLLPQVRIRLAALELFGDQGFDRTTVRQIAGHAGVSPALVMHHFGSKHQLRQAVDDWIMAFLVSEKGAVITGSLMPQLGDYLTEHPETRLIMNYLITSMREDGTIAEQVFDRMCQTTAQILELGVQQGTIRDLPDRDAAASVLVAYSLGASMLGSHLARRLGGESLLDAEPMRRYVLAAMRVFTHGLFTDDSYLRGAQAAFVHPENDDD